MSIDGLTLIEEVNQQLGLDLVDPHYDTIAGFVLGKLGRMPRPGDVVESGGCAPSRGGDGRTAYCSPFPHLYCSPNPNSLKTRIRPPASPRAEPSSDCLSMPEYLEIAVNVPQVPRHFHYHLPPELEGQVGLVTWWRCLLAASECRGWCCASWSQPDSAGNSPVCRRCRSQPW